MLCYAMLRYATLCYAMLCHAMLCYAMPCHAMLCYAMLCYAMLCYATQVKTRAELQPLQAASKRSDQIQRKKHENAPPGTGPL
jgi:hypothetical protein